MNVCKVLQTASNGIKFKESNQFSIINEWLNKNQQKIDNFLTTLAKIPKNWTDFVKKNIISDYNKSKVCSELHVELLCVLKELAITYGHTEKKTNFLELISVLTNLGPPNSRLCFTNSKLSHSLVTTTPVNYDSFVQYCLPKKKYNLNN